MINKTDQMKNILELVRVFNKVDDNTQFSTHGVCVEFVTKLTE